jgi:hypothetical protein
MHPLREHGVLRTATIDERWDAFGRWFDMDVDASTSLIPLLTRLGQNLARVVGDEQTARAFAQLDHCTSDWQEAVQDSEFYLMTKLGEKLTGLSAYAVFGLLGAGAAGEKTISETLATIEELLLDCPPERWLPDADREPLFPTLLMARARWNLDHAAGLSAEGLALLGNVKLSRIRNMMSGTSPELPKDTAGLLANEAARAWLDRRDCFLPTIATAAMPADLAELGDIMPIFLPVARDGSMFTPDVNRGGRYQIGEKGSEESLDNYDAALRRLQAMPIAKWRRPNENDNWGIVSAIEWRRVDRRAL